MENIIMQNEVCKLVEFLGNYQLYTMRTVNYDGIRERDLVHVMTFYDPGYVRDEISGRIRSISNVENINIKEYAVEAFERETEWIRKIGG